MYEYGAVVCNLHVFVIDDNARGVLPALRNAGWEGI
jgi:hypothetical protein